MESGKMIRKITESRWIGPALAFLGILLIAFIYEKVKLPEDLELKQLAVSLLKQK